MIVNAMVSGNIKFNFMKKIFKKNIFKEHVLINSVKDKLDVTLVNFKTKITYALYANQAIFKTNKANLHAMFVEQAHFQLQEQLHVQYI